MEECRKKTERVRAAMIIATLIVLTLSIATEAYCFETYFDGCSLYLNHQDTQNIVKMLDSLESGSGATAALISITKRIPEVGVMVEIISASAFMYKKWISYADEGNGVVIYHLTCAPWWVRSSLTLVSPVMSNCVFLVRTRNE